MNKHILMVIDHQMNPDKYTQEQLDKNTYAAAAYAAAAAAAAAAAFCVAAANACCMSTNENKNQLINESLNEYFRLSGESEQDYTDAINKDK